MLTQVSLVRTENYILFTIGAAKYPRILQQKQRQTLFWFHKLLNSTLKLILSILSSLDVQIFFVTSGL